MTSNSATPSVAGIALRDLDRLRGIASVAAQHGFGAFLQRFPMGQRLVGKVPGGDTELSTLSTPVRFAKFLAALGPTFIKLGQILSTRRDLLPPDWTTALESLQDDAPRVPFELVRAQVEAALGGPLEQHFAHFEVEPLGTASIGQTHRARTLQGDEVVVKVQRPDIERTMRADLDLLYLGAQLLEQGIDEMRLLGVVTIVEEFERGLLGELDFHQELSHLREFRRHLDPARRLTVPEPYPQLSARTVLTMQFAAGRPIRKLAPKSAAARAAVEELVLAFFRQVLVDGVFHGDPHAGNLLIGDDGTLCMIDLGLVGRVSPEQRDAMVTLAMAHFTRDTGTMARVLLTMGTPTQRVKLGEFKAEIDQIRTQYLDVSSLAAADTAGFIEAFSALAAKHRIRLPSDMAVLAKAAATLEGIVRTLHPDIDLIALARPMIEGIVRQRLSPKQLLGEMISEGSSVASMLRTVPGHLEQLLHDFEGGHLQLRALTPALDELPARLHALGGKLSLAAFSSATLTAAAILAPQAAGSMPMTVVATLLALASAFGWVVLLAWQGLGHGKPLKLAPLLRLFRR
jgi:ubiquinone biosynthesis protein